jgi:hypothetical protein
MTKRFTYKELTLILGIIVALIVVFTMWIRKPSLAFTGSPKLPKVSLLQHSKAVPFSNLLPLSRSIFQVKVVPIEIKNE